MYELNNGVISIGVEKVGAELRSLKKAGSELEYMWSGDPAYWMRVSPILFPFVGSLKNKEYRAKGKTYHMEQHGFVRDMEFELISKTEDEMWFEVRSNEETYEKYPYEFVLKLGYRLCGNQAELLWQVENPGKETLPFSIGGHPGFACPVEEGVSREDCFVKFGGVEEVVSSRVGEMGLMSDCMDVYPLSDGKLRLTENLFDHDALVIENDQTHEVSLCRKDGTPYIQVNFEDMPLFGVWSAPGKLAPYVCIEPWCGRCDREDFEGALEEREWGNFLEPGEVWKASYRITLF